jgi:kynurenine formamidase
MTTTDVPDGRHNWLRWGEDDELGAVNLLTPDVLRRAAGLVREGRVYSLAMSIERNAPMLGGRLPVGHFMTMDGGDYAVGATLAPDFGAADDYIMIATHGTTHMDALSHTWSSGLMYNGHPSSHVTSAGAGRLAIDKISSIVTRGVLLDVAGLHGDRGLEPGYRVTADDLDACLERIGLSLEPGDIPLLRLGWIHEAHHDPQRYAQARPGLDLSVIDWFADRDVAGIGTDAGMEPWPAPQDAPFGIHLGLLRNLGLSLLEMLDLEALSRDAVTEFMLIAAPLRIRRGVGSPLNPLAIV